MRTDETLQVWKLLNNFNRYARCADDTCVYFSDSFSLIGDGLYLFHQFIPQTLKTVPFWTINCIYICQCYMIPFLSHRYVRDLKQQIGTFRGKCQVCCFLRVTNTPKSITYFSSRDCITVTDINLQQDKKVKYNKIIKF